MATAYQAGYFTDTDIDIPDPEYYQTYVRSLVSYQKRKMLARNNKIKDMYDHRYGRHTVAVPAEFKRTDSEYHSPLIRDVIRRAVAITNDFPRPKVIPRKRLGVRAQENASLREKWMLSWLTCACRDKDTWGMIRDDMATSGCGVFKLIFKQHYWSSYGPRRIDESASDYNRRVREHHEEHFPFVWEHVESSSYYPVGEDENGIAEVLEITRREALPLMKKYGLNWDKNKGFSRSVGQVMKEPGDWSSLPDTVEFVEYWDRHVFCYFVAGVMVKAGEHDYGRPPYFSALASTTGSKNPVDQYEGIASPLVSIQDFQDSFTTIRMNWAYLNGFPVGRLVPISEDVVELPDISTIKYIPGQTISIPGYKWEWAPAPPVGDDLRWLSDWLEKQADTFSLAPILYGLPAGANVSGVATLQLIAIAKSLFAPGIANLIRAMNSMGAFVLYLIENVIQAPVPLYYEGDSKWLELGPDDIDGYYDFDFQLEPVIQAERIAKSQWLADLQARGLVTKSRVVEEGAGIHDPEAELDAVDLEVMTDRADYQSAVMREALRQLALEDYFTPPAPQPVEGIPAGGSGLVPMQQGIQLPLPQMQPGQLGQMAQPNPAQQAAEQGGTPARMGQRLY